MPEETGKEQKTGPSSETTHSAKQSSSAKGRKEIFFSRRGTTRTDNSHLKELHSLDMKMLLSQKQISDGKYWYFVRCFAGDEKHNLELVWVHDLTCMLVSHGRLNECHLRTAKT